MTLERYNWPEQLRRQLCLFFFSTAGLKAAFFIWPHGSAETTFVRRARGRRPEARLAPAATTDPGRSGARAPWAEVNAGCPGAGGLPACPQRLRLGQQPAPAAGSRARRAGPAERSRRRNREKPSFTLTPPRKPRERRQLPPAAGGPRAAPPPLT